MLIRLASDLHLEFGRDDYDLLIPRMPEDLVTTLLVPGDIHVGSQACDDFLPEMCGRFDHVVYVPGNHEFYHNEITSVATEIKYEMFDFPNFHLLDDDVWIHQGVRFIGGTLWTDCARRNPNIMLMVEQGMMDYECIKFRGTRLQVTDTIELHEATVSYLESVLRVEHDGPTVVLTHHLPSHQSIHPMFYRSTINNGFYSDLERLMHDYDIDWWFHGHTHQVREYELYGCKVRMNPRGYGEVPESPLYNPEFRLEIE